jgi:thiol-disulfide isomerase/thioredoxin
VENYGSSELARRFGVTRYPALFVNDVLVATPKDFGFFGKGEGGGNGRYTPWRSAESHARFRADLSRMIELSLAGRRSEAQAVAATPDAELARLPGFTFKDLDGQELTSAALAGRVVVIEFWATWCPPCQGTLSWLGGVKERFGNRIAVLALAIDSDEADVRKRASETGLPFTWALGTPELARSLGDVSAVPTLLLFDQKGETVASYLGAPPTLHEDAEARIAALLGVSR